MQKNDRCAQFNLQSLFRQSNITEDNLYHVIDVQLKKIAKNINDNEQNSQSRRLFEVSLNF